MKNKLNHTAAYFLVFAVFMTSIAIVFTDKGQTTQMLPLSVLSSTYLEMTEGGAGDDLPRLDLSVGEVNETIGVSAHSSMPDSIPEETLSPEMRVIIERIESEEYDNAALSGAGPHILIYHTHTTEAYRQDGEYTYTESSSWRTSETDKSIVAVGDVLTQQLEAQGFSVLHDTTNHEPPKLSTSYTRSLATMLSQVKNNPELSVFIDVHRDAYSDVSAGKNDVVIIKGERCARLMFVVGTGENYAEKPNFESNYALASALTEELESYANGLTRKIRVKKGRYNQQVSDKCLLVEIGHNANTLDEAKNAAKYLSKAIFEVIGRHN